MNVFLVEDDELLGEGMLSSLKHFGYNVTWFKSGNLFITAIKDQTPDIVLLDLGLPDIGGIDVLKTIRKTLQDLPVLIITARDDIEQKLIGLDQGADDYLVKPFDIRELEARIRTLLKRFKLSSSTILSIGIWHLDTATRYLSNGSHKYELSRREYPLAHAFFESPGKVFTRDALESLIYNWDDEIGSNALEVHIHNLRKKVGNNAIKTLRGVGYMLIKEYLF